MVPKKKFARSGFGRPQRSPQRKKSPHRSVLLGHHNDVTTSYTWVFYRYKRCKNSYHTNHRQLSLRQWNKSMSIAPRSILQTSKGPFRAFFLTFVFFCMQSVANTMHYIVHSKHWSLPITCRAARLFQDLQNRNRHILLPYSPFLRNPVNLEADLGK